VIQGIYRIRNKLDDKRYIGSTNDFENGWIGRRRTLRRGDFYNIHLQRAWNKYGEENFVFEIEEVVEDTNALLSHEQIHLDDGFAKGILYNIARKAGGGDLGEEVNSKKREWHPSEEAKQKNRDWHLKYYETHDGVMKDKKHSEEAKQKSSKSHKKYYETHDQWNKGKFREENPFFGKHHTQETKDDLSQQHKEWHKTNRVSNEPKGMYNKQHTQEAKGKMSDKKKEWHRTHEHPRGFLGRHHTEESRDKTRVSMEEWHQNHECPVAKSYPAFYNEGTGELISSGRNLKRLCRSKNLNYDSMLGVKTGYRKQTNDGWRLAV